MAANAESKKLTVEVIARIDKLEKGLQKASQAANDNFGKIERRSAQMTKKVESNIAKVGNGLRGGLAGLAAGLAGAVSAGAIAAAAKEYTALQNALRVTGMQGEELEKTFGALFQIAQRQGAAISPLVGLYSKLSLSQKELGVSNQELLTFTEGIATALRAGGTSATEASGALLQLSQALGGGVVRAEEFNSMLEATPTIVQTVARGLAEAGGSVAKLRSLVNDGAVSSRAFFEAFRAGFPELAAQADRATDTTDQGITRVANAFTALVGKLDETTGASRNATGSLTAVGDAIGRLPAYIDAAVGKLQNLRNWLSEVGNSDIWRKLGEFMGVDYSPEGIAKNLGYTPPSAGSGGIGSDSRIPLSAPPTTVSVTQFPAAPSKEKKGRKGAGGGRDKQDYSDLIASADQRIDQMRVEQQALGMTTAAAEALRFQEDLLAQAKSEGIALSPTEIENLKAKATEYGNLAGAIEEASNAQADLSALGKDALGSFIGDLREGKSASEALAGALERVADKLLDITLDSLFSTSGGGGFNLLGALFGGVKAATGGHISGPGTGTSDSIPARLSNGEYVVNAKATKKNRALLEAINSGRGLAMASGGLVGSMPRMPNVAGVGQRVAPSMSFSTTVDARGSTMGEDQIRRIVAEGNRRTVQEVRRSVSGWTQEDSMRGGARRGTG